MLNVSHNLTCPEMKLGDMQTLELKVLLHQWC